MQLIALNEYLYYYNELKFPAFKKYLMFDPRNTNNPKYTPHIYNKMVHEITLYTSSTSRGIFIR